MYNDIFQDVAFQLIGFEVSLITIYFTMIPLIINNKEDVYLGYKVSKWILYDRRDKNCFLSHLFGIKIYSAIFLSWTYNVLLIVFSIVLFLRGDFAIVFILFLVFIFLLSRDIFSNFNLQYADIYKKEIENDFIKRCNADSKLLFKQLIDNERYNIGNYKVDLSNNIDFMLDNYDTTKNVFDLYYDYLMKKQDIEVIYIVLSKISTKIHEKNEPLNILINHEDLIYFIIY